MPISIKTALLSLALFIPGGSAFALCSAPVVEFPTDLIIQLSSANGQAMIGTAESIGVNSRTARSRGAMVFDSSSGGVLMCDGTDWIAPFAAQTASGGGATEYKYYGDWILENGPRHPTYSAPIPADQVGEGDWSFNVYARGDCAVYMINSDGSEYHPGSANYTTMAGDRMNETEYYDLVIPMVVRKLPDGTYEWKSGSTVIPQLRGPFEGTIRGRRHCPRIGFQNVERLR